MLTPSKNPRFKWKESLFVLRWLKDDYDGLDEIYSEECRDRSIPYSDMAYTDKEDT